jgi:hypothetical protein
MGVEVVLYSGEGGCHGRGPGNMTSRPDSAGTLDTALSYTYRDKPAVIQGPATAMRGLMTFLAHAQYEVYLKRYETIHSYHWLRPASYCSSWCTYAQTTDTEKDLVHWSRLMHFYSGALVNAVVSALLVLHFRRSVVTSSWKSGCRVVTFLQNSSRGT